MKAFCLAFALVLVAFPAGADDLPQTGNAWRANEPDLAEPGNFRWTVLDDAAGRAQAPAAVTWQDARRKDAPARAALAQIRAETARVFAEARRASAKIQRMRYDLRVSCVVDVVAYEPDPLATVSVPWIWDSMNEEDRKVEGTVERCDVDYSHKVRSQVDPKPQMLDYTVSFPVSD
ncbi:MAG TPA: hypothetical protein VIG38_08595 [Hyphomicrobium sp.]